MGRLAESVADVKRGRDYKPQAIDRILATIDADDREALLGLLRANHQDVTARTVAEKIITKSVPEYPELAFFAELKDPDQAVRTWRSRHRNG
jgi:hypothetical protein